MAKDQPIIAQADFGNSDFNLILCKPDGSKVEKIMPHDFLRLDDTQWNRRVSRAKVQKARVDKSQCFKIKLNEDTMIPVLIGEEARLAPDSHKQLGSNKYEVGYMDALVCAGLSELLPVSEYPKGHDNIILGIGYPTTEIDHLERLIGIVGQAHYIEDVDGKKRKFVIRQVVPTDEALGGLLRYKELYGDMNYFDLDPGKQIIWIDIGGHIGSMGVVTMNEDGNLVPLYREVRAINQGILDTFEALRDTLSYHHPEQFRGMIPSHNMLKEALLEKEIHFAKTGVTLDVTNAVMDACSILDDIDRIYKSRPFNSGRGFEGIVMTGGGTGALSNLLIAMLSHQSALPADNLDTINFANVRGGLIATLAALITDGLLPEIYQDVFYAETNKK